MSGGAWEGVRADRLGIDSDGCPVMSLMIYKGGVGIDIDITVAQAFELYRSLRARFKEAARLGLDDRTEARA